MNFDTLITISWIEKKSFVAFYFLLLLANSPTNFRVLLKNARPISVIFSIVNVSLMFSKGFSTLFSFPENLDIFLPPL